MEEAAPVAEAALGMDHTASTVVEGEPTGGCSCLHCLRHHRLNKCCPVVRPTLKSVFGIEGTMRDGPNSYRVMSVVAVSPIYAAMLVTFGTLAGRHRFFANMSHKIFGRFLPQFVLSHLFRVWILLSRQLARARLTKVEGFSREGTRLEAGSEQADYGQVRTFCRIDPSNSAARLHDKHVSSPSCLFPIGIEGATINRATAIPFRGSR